SSSSKIFLQNLSRNDDKNKPGRYSLKPLSENEIKGKEPRFNGRQTVIRLDSGVQLIKLNGSKDEVVTFGNTGNNGTFGIVKEANVNLEADEWKKVLLPWTVRGPDNDNKFQLINREPGKYSQRYRIRENG
ncbi:pilus assembly/adherence protein PilC, partial [Neisseria gonorrhoeae]